jgi:zinc transport system permease protein
MDFICDIYRYAFLHNALIACILSGISCGIVGTYVVCRRTVFLAGGITHASFGGLGIAFYLGQNPILGAMAFAVLSAVGIEWVGERAHIREDSAIGIIWSVGMAIGVLFMSLRPGYTSGDLAGYLFGNILTVTTLDLYLLSLLTLLLIVGAAVWLRPIMYVAFDREYARSQGIHTRTIAFLMATLSAVTIVLAIRVMGIVLLLSLMTLPAVTMNVLSKSYKTIAAGAAVLGALGAVAGLVVSYQWEIPSGVAIIFILTLSLVVVKLLPLLFKKREAKRR